MHNVYDIIRVNVYYFYVLFGIDNTDAKRFFCTAYTAMALKWGLEEKIREGDYRPSENMILLKLSDPVYSRIEIYCIFFFFINIFIILGVEV